MSAMRTRLPVSGCLLLSAICLSSIAFAQTNWARTYGGTRNDEGLSVQQTYDGGYIIAGYTSSFGAGDDDVYLIKVNSAGDTLWTRTYGGPGRDEGNSVQQTADGGFIIAGYTGPYYPSGLDVGLLSPRDEPAACEPQTAARWPQAAGGPNPAHLTRLLY
jgi:hypothetical protein